MTMAFTTTMTTTMTMTTTTTTTGLVGWISLLLRLVLLNAVASTPVIGFLLTASRRAPRVDLHTVPATKTTTRRIRTTTSSLSLSLFWTPKIGPCVGRCGQSHGNFQSHLASMPMKQQNGETIEEEDSVVDMKQPQPQENHHQHQQQEQQEQEQQQQDGERDKTTYQRLRKFLPVSIQYGLRDSGLLRTILDSVLVPLQVPSILDQYPTAFNDYLQLSGLPFPNGNHNNNNHKSQFTTTRTTMSKYGDSNSNGSVVEFQQIRYGDHPSNVIDLILPQQQQRQQPSSLEQSSQSASVAAAAAATTTVVVDPPTPLIVFVHGGAWGSGYPAMYRNVAAPFVLAQMNVAIVGYRTYPDALVPDQVNDLQQALHVLLSTRHNPNNKNNITQHQHYQYHSLFSTSSPTFILGHSSGSHIVSLALWQTNNNNNKNQNKKNGLNSTTTIHNNSHKRFSSLLSSILEPSQQQQQQNQQQVDDNDNDHDDDDHEDDNKSGGEWNGNLVGVIGLTGVYDIPNHYDFETQRGIELISPLSIACGGKKSAWERYSLTRILKQQPKQQQPKQQQPISITLSRTPPPSSSSSPLLLQVPTLICHGRNDMTVPFSSSVDYVTAWRWAWEQQYKQQQQPQDDTLSSSSSLLLSTISSSSSICELKILDDVDHSEMIFHLMFGGPTRDVVMDWIHGQLGKKNKKNL